MPIDDPATWIAGATAVKTAIDSLRAAIGIAKDVRSVAGGTPDQQKAIDDALTVASSNTAIAEAAFGQAFGYQLCKCEFPPIPMRTVEYFTVQHGKGRATGDPIYECPKCGYSNAGPFNYQRTASPRAQTS